MIPKYGAVNASGFTGDTCSPVGTGPQGGFIGRKRDFDLFDT
jgi:hypothetical protein